MRIDPAKKVRHVANENIVIMQGGGVTDLTRLVALNKSAMALYDRLKGIDFDVDTVARTLCDLYEVDAATALTDAAEWVAAMRRQHLIID